MICYCDGACSGNPGPGGYGVVVLNDLEELILTDSAHSDNTTNNREELKAIIYVMKHFGKERGTVVYSDSAYAVNTLNNWMFGWAAKGWVKSDKKVPENLDLIQEYYQLYLDNYRIDLRKCSGHSGVYWNEVADRLAVAARDDFDIVKKEE